MFFIDSIQSKKTDNALNKISRYHNEWFKLKKYQTDEFVSTKPKFLNVKKYFQSKHTNSKINRNKNY